MSRKAFEKLGRALGVRRADVTEIAEVAVAPPPEPALIDAAVRQTEGPTTEAAVVPLPQPALNLLLLGTCQSYPLLLDAATENCRVDHYLLGCQPHDDIRMAELEWASYDAVVVSPVLRHVLTAASGQDNELFFWRLDEAGVAILRDQCIAYMNERLAWLAQVTEGSTIVTGFWEPSFLYAGPTFRFDDGLDFKEFVHEINKGLARATRTYADFWFLDPNLVLESIGRAGAQDDVMASASHAAFLGDWDFGADQSRIVAPVEPMALFNAGRKTHDYGRGMLQQVRQMLAALSTKDKTKLVILDLDDTLWRGVAAEDDIHDSGRREGWPLGVAEALLIFKRRGGLLAICSKNDRDETLKRFRKIWGELLVEGDFASVSISWSPKPEGIAQILSEVNVLPEHTLFIDDNPREVDEVRSVYPTMQFVGFNHYLWRQHILTSPDMQAGRISAESAQRTTLVRAKVQREAGAVGLDRDSWLRSQELRQITTVIDTVDHPEFARALELINKTNQFNTTGRRWDAVGVGGLFAGGGYFVVSRLIDKHVDNGLIGVAIVLGSVIEQAVLSCRVFNLGAEVGLISDAVRLILRTHDTAIGVVTETGKNFVCLGVYEKLGFRREKGVFMIDHAPARPDWIDQRQAEAA